MEQKVIVLRGAPASGKSTIAKSFRNFEKKIVWLKVDNFKDFFADDASAALDYVNGASIATLEYLLDEKFSVVIEGIFQNPRSLEQILSSSAAKGVPCLVFELDAPLEALQQRKGDRDGEALTRIYKILNDRSRKDAIKIDTIKYSLEECKDKIIKSFEDYDKEHPYFEGA